MRWSRRQYTDKWEQSVPRPFWFGARGSSVQKGVWKASLAAEYAQATKQSVATAMVDVEKAFERFNFRWLCRAAQRYGFPLRMLRGLLVLYSGARCLVVDGIATSIVHAMAHGVIAGCAHATAMMKLALLESLDHTVAKWPLVETSVVVDDTQFQAVGTKQLVEAVVRGATNTFCEHAREHAGLAIHPGKLCVFGERQGYAASDSGGSGCKA